MNKSKSEQIIIITGDVTMDWNLAYIYEGAGSI